MKRPCRRQPWIPPGSSASIPDADKHKEDKEEDFEIIKSETTDSEIKDNSQKSIFSGMSQIIGLSNIFQKGHPYISFKVQTKKESFISFLNEGDNNNNKLIVVDKLGNYTLAEINMNKKAKIIKRDLLI